MIQKSVLETLIDMIFHGNTAAADACREIVTSELVPQLLLTYRYLTDWSAKERCIILLQDHQDKGMKAVMLDFLQAPAVRGDEQREYTKAIALGFMGEKYKRPQAYFYDRDLLYMDINEVLNAHQMRPVNPKKISKEDIKIIKHQFKYNPEKTSHQNLMNGAWTNNIQLMMDAVSHGAHLDNHIGSGNKKGCTPLIIALMFKHFEAAYYLIQQGANVNAYRKHEKSTESKDGQTPLWWAAKHGHLHLCELLIELGANVGTPDWHGSRPLHQAASHGHLAVVHLLLEKGANVDAQIYDGRKAIHLATLYGHTEMVHLLLDEGNEPNEKSDSGFHLLFTAVDKGHEEIVELLIEYGADVNALHSGSGIYQSLKAWSPLTFAMRAGNIKIIKLLLEAGANPLYEVPVFDYQRKNQPQIKTKNLIEFASDSLKGSIKKLLQQYSST